MSAPIGIKKQDLKKGTMLTVQVSSGDHPREAVQAVADRLAHRGIEHELTLSRRKKLPRWTEVKLRVDDPLMPSACAHIVDEMSKVLGANDENYSVCLAGGYRHGFSPEDGEVIPHTRSQRYGYALGHWIGSSLRRLRARE